MPSHHHSVRPVPERPLTEQLGPIQGAAAKVSKPRLEEPSESDGEGPDGSSDEDAPLPGEVDEDSGSDTVVEDEDEGQEDEGMRLAVHDPTYHLSLGDIQDDGAWWPLQCSDYIHEINCLLTGATQAPLACK